MTFSASRLPRRTLVASALAFSLLGVLGCQQSTPTATTDTSASPAATAASSAVAASPAAVAETYPTPPKPDGTLKIGLITPGSTKTDTAWSALAWQGVQQVKAATGATVTPPIEHPDAASVAGDVRNLAQGGDQLIFLHGEEFNDPAASVAPDFPKTTFVVVGGKSVKPNLTPIVFDAGGACYLAGMVAGTMTKTNKLGCVGGTEIPIVKEAFDSFAKGAKSVNPKVDVRVVFTGDDTDVSKAKQQTEALLADGVDVVQHDADDAGHGVAQAIEGKPGTMFLGANADQSDLATKQNLGSFILDVPAAYLAAGKAVADGKGTGKPLNEGLAEHAVYFKFNDKFAGKFPADLKTKVTAAEKDIIAGKLTP